MSVPSSACVVIFQSQQQPTTMALSIAFLSESARNLKGNPPDLFCRATHVNSHPSHLYFVFGFLIYKFLLSCIGFPYTTAICFGRCTGFQYIQRVMLISSTKFFSATNHISSGPINHTHGRASMVDSSIIYSPNCGRTVKMLPMFPDIEFLLNTGRHVDTLHQPLWWSQENAFLAFLPINPNFFGVPFEDFNNIELQRGLTGYIVQKDALLKQSHTEFILRILSYSFVEIYGMPKGNNWSPLSMRLSVSIQPSFNAI